MDSKEIHEKVTQARADVECYSTGGDGIVPDATGEARDRTITIEDSDFHQDRGRHLFKQEQEEAAATAAQA